jgi:hypothetical protein
MNTNTNIALLKTLSDDYYHNRISFAEYRKERTQILKCIDEDVNGVIIAEDNAEIDKSFINKALAFLKIDKFKESS